MRQNTKKSNAKSALGSVGGFRKRRSEWLYFLAGGLIVAFGLGVWTLARGHPTTTHSSSLTSKDQGRGPTWGRLEYRSITLERPDESFPPLKLKPEPIRWFFPDYGVGELERFLGQLDLTAEQKQILLDRSRWKMEARGCLVFPPTELVRDLPTPVRRAVYGVLKQSPRNYYENNPLRIPVGNVDNWLAHSGLSEAHQKLFRQVSYHEGETLWFSDFQLFEQLSTPAEKRQMGKVVSQIPALMMNLRIAPDTDINALVDYWGKGGRGQAMRPFLESLKRIPEGASISIAYFLPAFARLRLYTYPNETTNHLAKREDCFWTAMNFFNDNPDDRFFDAKTTKTTLANDYLHITNDFTFGDLLLLEEDHQMAIHMCVYIADNVVFTKNGSQDLQPWVLTKIPDMMACYAGKRQIFLHGYRRKSS